MSIRASTWLPRHSSWLSTTWTGTCAKRVCWRMNCNWWASLVCSLPANMKRSTHLTCRSLVKSLTKPTTATSYCNVKAKCCWLSTSSWQSLQSLTSTNSTFSKWVWGSCLTNSARAVPRVTTNLKSWEGGLSGWGDTWLNCVNMNSTITNTNHHWLPRLHCSCPSNYTKKLLSGQPPCSNSLATLKVNSRLSLVTWLFC